MKSVFFGLVLVVTVTSALQRHIEGKRCNITVSICDDSRRCTDIPSIVITDYWTEYEEGNLIYVEDQTLCRVILCEHTDLMGYCAQVRPNDSQYLERFRALLHNETLSATCFCPSPLEGNVTIEDDQHFDRNYVGVVYSPYDRSNNKENGGIFPWIDYKEQELRGGLELIKTKFSYLSTYGIGTLYSNTDWDFAKGNKMSLAPKIAAKINRSFQYPVLRISVGIWRKNHTDKTHADWNSKEVQNAVNASKLANQEFNGTVWGIVISNVTVTNPSTAENVIEIMEEVRSLSKTENLYLKVGFRCEDECMKFINVTQDLQRNLSPSEVALRRVAEKSDLIICTIKPKSHPEYGNFTISDMKKKLKHDFIELRNALSKIKPSLRLVIETGIPSVEILKGANNSILELKKFWYEMAEFAKEKEIMFHMYEALNQPWKFGKSSDDDYASYYGWWKRVNDSIPPVYIEKITEKSQLLVERTLGGELVPDSPKSEEPVKSDGDTETSVILILMISFGCFVLFTTSFIGYLWMKLRKTKRQVISPVYISQFMTGGDDVEKTDNYAVALRIPYDRKRYEMAKETFHIDKSAVIGSGQCGLVCRGTISGHLGPVAFKCTSPSSTVLDIKSLLSEIKILSYIGEHQNILCILGAYTKKIERGIVYLALEYCSLGSLESFLRKADTSKLDQLFPSNSNRNSGSSFVPHAQLDNSEDYSDCLNSGYMNTTDFTSDSSEGFSTYVKNREIATISVTSANHSVDLCLLYKWAYQIASAMEYVAAKNVIHSDLASRNVLLLELDQVKVADFGLSRRLYHEVGVVHDKDTPLPWRWMAPESLKHLVVSVETDVWAFGVTIWEIFSLAEVPYHGVIYSMQFSRELEKGEIRLPQAKYASSELHEVLMKCWDTTSSNRPSFTFLKEFFQDNTS